MVLLRHRATGAWLPVIKPVPDIRVCGASLGPAVHRIVSGMAIECRSLHSTAYRYSTSAVGYRTFHICRCFRFSNSVNICFLNIRQLIQSDNVKLFEEVKAKRAKRPDESRNTSARYLCRMRVIRGSASDERFVIELRMLYQVTAGYCYSS